MAVYKIFPTQDATLYSIFPQMNTGLDEIIESTQTQIATENNSNPQVSRFLIQFSQDEIDDIIENKMGISSSAQLMNTSSWNATLNCFIATETGLALNTQIDCFPIYVNPAYGGWGMGTGKYLDEPEISNGTSWIWIDYSGSNKWITSNYPPNTTGSFNTNYAQAGGGNWWTGSNVNYFNSNLYPITASQIFSYSSDKDINLNVSNIIRAQYTGAITSDGFIVKLSPATEFVNNINVQPELKFFSVDTNTIYPPQLEFKWRDYTWNTGSSTLTILNTLPAVVTLAQNPGYFYSGSINRFRINSRPEYPPQLWQTSSVYTQNYYLPTASYWAIKDLDTNEFVINFDNQFTQLNADVSGSYFDLNMNGLQTERYYTVLIKTTINNSTIVYNDNYSFKIING
jgi:hypothetical protein